MKRKYLGDSYDLVKRFWAEGLHPIARLYAHPRFIPTELRASYEACTGMRIFNQERLERPFAVLLDPSTGIKLTIDGSSGPRATPEHVSLSYIIELVQQLKPRFLVCFDQSYHRRHELSREGQRERKRVFLRDRGVASFYYVSHATFLFVARNKVMLDSVRQRLISLGLPECRFETGV